MTRVVGISKGAGRVGVKPWNYGCSLAERTVARMWVRSKGGGGDRLNLVSGLESVDGCGVGRGSVGKESGQ